MSNAKLLAFLKEEQEQDFSLIHKESVGSLEIYDSNKNKGFLLENSFKNAIKFDKEQNKVLLGENYKMIGLEKQVNYKGELYPIASSSTILFSNLYVPLFQDLSKHQDKPIEGEYYITGTDSLFVYEKLRRLFESSDIQIEELEEMDLNQFGNQVLDIYNNQFVIGIILLLLANIILIAKYWIESRKEELTVIRVVGFTQGQSIRYLLKQYGIVSGLTIGIVFIIYGLVFYNNRGLLYIEYVLGKSFKLILILYLISMVINLFYLIQAYKKVGRI